MDVTTLVYGFFGFVAVVVLLAIALAIFQKESSGKKRYRGKKSSIFGKPKYRGKRKSGLW